MTEKEKAQKGYLYDANNDAALLEERALCQDLCFQYNGVRPSMIEKGETLIKKIIGKTKEI